MLLSITFIKYICFYFQMINGMKSLVLFLGLTTSMIAQDFKQMYMKYFKGEITKDIYSYNHIETYADEHYMSSLLAKDISSLISENYPLEIGPITELIAKHDRESGWSKELGAGVYAQFPTPKIMYGELYYMPYWVGEDAYVIGGMMGIYPSDNISVYGSIDYLVENVDKEKSSDMSVWLSIDVEF